MKRLVLGALGGACFTVAVALVVEGGSEAFAQRFAATPPAPSGGLVAGSATAGPSGELIVVSQPAERGQTLTVVDPRQQALGVYFVDGSTGKITLRSVRSIRWDLQMTYLNNDPPLPQEIRAMLEQR
ncbi:MAG: hypothetical protein ACOY3P_04110 [Planctomycetota bacterium]